MQKGYFFRVEELKVQIYRLLTGLPLLAVAVLGYLNSKNKEFLLIFIVKPFPNHEVMSKKKVLAIKINRNS